MAPVVDGSVGGGAGGGGGGGGSKILRHNLSQLQQYRRLVLNYNVLNIIKLQILNNKTTSTKHKTKTLALSYFQQGTCMIHICTSSI